MTDRALRRFFVVVMLTLMGFGCIAVYSATAVMSYETYGQSGRFVLIHVLAIGIGLAAAIACLGVPFPTLRRWAKWLVLLSLALLVLVKLFGAEGGGARRWFRLGWFNMQPSEFAKVALVLYVADFLDRKRGVVQQLRDGFAPPLIVSGAIAALVLLQPDLGSAVVLGAVTLLLLVIAKARWQHVAGTLVVGALAMAVLIAGEGYRQRRMLAFLNPWDDPQGAGFQILQSYVALGNGGVVGQGLGASMQKLFYLPSAHTDFIFAVIGEELGLVGTTAVMGLFALLLSCCIRMAYTTADPFRKYLISGFAGLMGLEAVVHIAVVTGMMPTKGLPLPLVSYGGSAMVANCLACALVLQASRNGSAEWGMQHAD